MYDTPWRLVFDHFVFRPAKCRLLQVFIVFIMAMCALSDVSSSDTSEPLVQLVIDENRPQNYTLQTNNTNGLKLRIKVPSRDCIGNVTFRSKFIPISGAPGGTNCESLGFVWKVNGDRLELVIRGYELDKSVVYGNSDYNVIMDGVYDFNSPSNNIKFPNMASLTYPCKLNFSGGSNGMPNYFGLTVESKGFASCKVEFALLGVDNYVLPTTTTAAITSTSTTEKPDQKTQTMFSETTSEPSIYPQTKWYSNIWLVIGLIAGFVFLVIIIVILIVCCLCNRRSSNVRVRENPAHEPRDLDYVTYCETDKSKNPEQAKDIVQAPEVSKNETLANEKNSKIETENIKNDKQEDAAEIDLSSHN